MSRLALVFVLLAVTMLPLMSDLSVAQSLREAKSKAPDPCVGSAFIDAEKRARLAGQRSSLSSFPYAEGLLQVAQLYKRNGCYRLAAQNFEKILKLAPQLHPLRDLWLNTVRVHLGLTYYEQVRLPEAERQYLLAKKFGEANSGTKAVFLAAVNNNLGFLYWRMGRFKESETLLNRARDTFVKELGDESFDLANNRTAIGALHWTLGRFSKAEEANAEALEIFDAIGGSELARLRPLNNLAQIYRNQLHLEESFVRFNRVLSIQKEYLGDRHTGVALTYNNLGGLHKLLAKAGGKKANEHFLKAKELYDNAISIFTREHGGGNERVGLTRHNLAELLYDRGRYEEAKKEIQRSIEIREKELEPEHSDVIGSLHLRARIYEALGRKELAESEFERALNLQLRAVDQDQDHIKVIEIRADLAGLYGEMGNWSGAAEEIGVASKSVKRRAARGATTNDSRAESDRRTELQLGKRVFERDVQITWRLSATKTAGRPSLQERSFHAAQLARQTTADAALAQMGARQAKGDPLYEQLVRQLQDSQRMEQVAEKQFQNSIALSPKLRDAPPEKERRRKWRKDRDAFRVSIKKLDSRLRKLDPKYWAHARPKPLTLAATKALLRPDEALVLLLDLPAIMPAQEETFIWVVTKDKSRWFRSSFGRKRLTDIVATLRRSLDRSAGNLRGAVSLNQRIKRKSDFDTAVAHDLYASLLQPAEDLVGNKKHLILIPSGPLTALPFYVLLTEAPNANGKYRSGKRPWLIRRHALTTLPSVASLSVLRRSKKKKTAPKNFIGFADPVFRPPAIQTARLKQPLAIPTTAGGYANFNRDAQSNRQALAALPRLSDTAIEVRSIAGLFKGGTEIYIGAQASETVVKQVPLEQYRIIHFATHGLVAGDFKHLVEPALALSTPTTLNKAGDDGLLTASEVMQLKLNADWVILSACNTAAGDRPGAEALSGLARAFFYAGTRALLVSHWPVASPAAVEITTATLRELRSEPTIGRGEALRRAMIALADSNNPTLAHPSYWAPFVIVGEGGADPASRSPANGSR